jgi:flavin-dependent dehydrogenase
MNPMRETDLAVIGGGFAGLACAQAAASRGLRTIVFERRPSIGHSPNTTGLLVKEVADLWDVPRRYTRKIHGVRLYGPSLRWVDLERPGYFFLATDTPAVLRWWAEEAERAGAGIYCGRAFQSAQSDDSGMVTVTTTGESEIVRSRFLIGADGVSSSVARACGLGKNRRWLPAVEAEFEGIAEIDPDRLHVFLDTRVAPGYLAWAVPGVGITQIGLAANRPHPINLNAFLDHLRGVFNFDRAKLIGHRAGKIPVGGPVRPIGRGNALLVGDAAGMVSPLTAGGIHTALDLGRQAGLAVCDYLLDGGPIPADVVHAAMPKFYAKRLLRLAFDHVPPPNWSIDAALGFSPLRALAQVIFFHHRGLLSLDAWRDMVWRVALGRG